MYSSDTLSVYLGLAGNRLRAEAFAQKYQVPLIEAEKGQSISSKYVLKFDADLVELVPVGKGASGGVSASFLVGKNAHRRKFGGGKGQLIAKAVGLKSGIYPDVLDATAGLGRDAFVLASLGCRVQMLERSPVVVELLHAAIEEARGSDIDDVVKRMALVPADGRDWLEEQSGAIADVIYLDPMYPHREKSSSVKKEMKIFQDVVGDDIDSGEILEKALSRARYRVVVKRPRKGESLNGVSPTYKLEGKSTRYDIYAIKSIDALKSQNSD